MAQPLYDPPKTGGDTLAWCTKCKMDLAHVIVSMIGPRPAKVICKTCKSQHNFRSARGDLDLPGMPRKPKPRAAAVPKTTVRAADYWEKKMAEKTAAPLMPYAPKEVFQLGDVIKHAQFGVGIVEEVRKGGKMVVLFREGDKLLVFGLGKSL
jgi:hypothetical protein